MKKFYLLSLAIPVVAGAIFVRSWLLSRPRDVFYGTGEIRSLVFSNDGKTLLVTQRNPNWNAANELTALHFDRSFTPKWSYRDGEELGTPQFFLSDSRVLVDRGFVRTLDANTGQELRKEGDFRRAEISPDGKWLAYKGARPSDGGCIPPQTIAQTFIYFKSPSEPNEDLARTIPHWTRALDTFRFSPDGQKFVIRVHGSSGTQLKFHDVRTGNQTHIWPDFKANTEPGFVQWSRNGRYLISVYRISAGKGPQALVNLWRVRDGALISSLTAPGIEEATGMIFPFPENITLYPCFELQNDGRILQFGVDDSVSLSKSTNLNAGFETLFSLPSEKITTATLSPDGLYLVAGTRSGQVVWKQVK